LNPENYGEDNEKGMTIFYPNYSVQFEFIKLKFREYHKLTIDLNKITFEELKEKIKQFSNPTDFIRFSFRGDYEKINALDVNMIESAGIDCEIKRKPLACGGAF